MDAPSLSTSSRFFSTRLIGLLALTSIVWLSSTRASAQTYVYPVYQQPQPQVVYAQQPVYEQPPIHNHDQGLMLRMVIGGGYTLAPERESDVRISGGSLIYDFAIGGSILPNFVLEADAFGLYALSPNVSNGGSSVSTGANVSFLAAGLGGGFTYWFMPANVYFSAAVGFSIAQIEVDGFITGESDLGVGFNTVLGKEWWVAPYWGLGIAAQVMYMTMPDGGGRLDVFSAGLGLSVSYQ